MNEKELIISCSRKITHLKSRLSQTDYYTNKFVEGELTQEEFEPIKAQRKAWEELIFQLKKKILEEEEAEKNAENNNNASKDGDN